LVAEICGILTENVIANKLTHGPFMERHRQKSRP
jgi:hypothetical protein